MVPAMALPAPFLYLAPLHGITGRVFRGAFFSCFPGFDAAVAPFILSVKAGDVTEKHFKDLLPGPGSGPGSGPLLIPQILGNDGSAMVATARMLRDLGYGEIDWNLGCPYPMVADKGKGSGLLSDPGRIDRILGEVFGSLPPPFSVKIRLGRFDARELDALVPVLNRYPLSRVVVHPRLGVQMYGGEVDLDGFGRAASMLAAPTVYNGDIRSAAGFAALRERFPEAAGWMIGRGALENPFLPGDIAGLPRPADPLASVADYHRRLYADYAEVLSGPRHALDKMKELWSYLSRSFADGERVFRRISRAKKSAEYEAAAASIFRDGQWIA
jgi:tRNA-dihydrouridine synthase